MSIQKENDLIQEAFEIEADEMGFCLDQKWGDYENPYENKDTALAFNLFKKGWQAKSKAVPDGFVLVPKDALMTILCNCSDAMENESTSSIFDETGEPSAWFDHHVEAERRILKLIPDAQEQSHDSE